MRFQYALLPVLLLVGMGAERVSGPKHSSAYIDKIVGPLVADLHRAGDEHRCNPEVQRARKALAEDQRLTDADLLAAKDAHDYRGKGRMPYPSPGTACAIFGIYQALEEALADRGVPTKNR